MNDYDKFGHDYFAGKPLDYTPDERQTENNELMIRLMDFKEGEKVLDVGCGTGRVEWLLPQCDVTSTDINPIIQKFIKGKFIACSMTDLPFPDEYFDKIVCNGVIAHFSESDKGVEECFRVLKKGGKMWVLTPNKPYVWLLKWSSKLRGLKFAYDSTAKWIRTKRSFMRLFRKFSKVHFQYFRKPLYRIPFKKFSEKMLIVATK